ncbi:MAG TPA: hypothetical protein VMA09_00495 [Candidatus Binataceae bacterium]|nr:hypothetical protein [Candidatus Binataceae bacterium]
MKRSISLGLVMLLVLMATRCLAEDISQTKTAGPYRVKLELLPPEPFSTAKQVSAGEAKSGMLILGGAEPVQPDAPSHPNHHLVVHVFDKATNKALTNANVKLSYQALDSSGKPAGTRQDVPVVRMQMISTGAMGAMSGMSGMAGDSTTHYGNNVSLAPGDYRVLAIANGHRASFIIKVAE